MFPGEARSVFTRTRSDSSVVATTVAAIASVYVEPGGT